MAREHDTAAKEHEGLRRWLPWAGGVTIFLGFAAVVYAMVFALSGTPPPPQPKLQQISIVQPPPPPPPPPEIEQPPPEAEQQVEVPEPEPEPVAETEDSDEPPPGDELGLDADGAAGSDGFGLRAKKGGRGLIGGGDRKAWYAGVLQRDLQRLLSEIEDVRKGRYAVIVRIWVADDGSIARSEIVHGSGDGRIDDALTRALKSGIRLSAAPPADLPQPIKLQISSRS
ncbi:MAG TPA: TonB C-terminal domain-containing protein [Gammaproteobacteria bacterium]|mgnify:CR=1 FL=1|nr:TonB C-terminal domain-containing protein [Gammaproteobacteria bacterium]